MVGSSLVVSTMAENVPESDYPYQVWFPGLKELWISKAPIFQVPDGIRASNTNPFNIYNHNTGIYTQYRTTSFEGAYFTTSPYAYKLVFVDGTGWVGDYLDMTDGFSYNVSGVHSNKTYILSLNPDSYSTQSVFVSSAQKTANLGIYTGSDVKYWKLPSFGSITPGIPDLPFNGVSMPDVNNAIDTAVQKLLDSINQQTEVGQRATTIINNTTNIYNQYQAGDITYQTLQQNVTNNLNELNQLSQSDTATIADLVQINNAITYNQAIQDVALQEREEQYWNQRDIESSVSDKSKTSDSEELDYIDSLQKETTSQLSDFAPSGTINTQAQNEVKSNILSVVWDNALIKLILPLAGAFMIVCVALGIKYRL